MLYSTQQAQTLQLSALLMDTNLKQRQKSKQKGKRDTLRQTRDFLVKQTRGSQLKYVFCVTMVLHTNICVDFITCIQLYFSMLFTTQNRPAFHKLTQTAICGKRMYFIIKLKLTTGYQFMKAIFKCKHKKIQLKYLYIFVKKHTLYSL